MHFHYKYGREQFSKRGRLLALDFLEEVVNKGNLAVTKKLVATKLGFHRIWKMPNLPIIFETHKLLKFQDSFSKAKNPLSH